MIGEPRNRAAATSEPGGSDSSPDTASRTGTRSPVRAPATNAGSGTPDATTAGTDTQRTPRSARGRRGEACIFVLDTNVLMHDPTALFRFQEHDVYLPMAVLEELDAAKKGVSEIARNVREVSRSLDGLIRDADGTSIDRGIRLPGAMDGAPAGRLFFQIRTYPDALPEALPGHAPDNGILNVVRALAREHPGRSVIVVSKDINLRIKARVLGIHAEDYRDDIAVDDVSLLYPGVYAMPDDFRAARSDAGGAGKRSGRTFHRAGGAPVSEWFPNQCLHARNSSEAGVLVREVRDGGLVVEPALDFRTGERTVWGVRARNLEQNFALNLLLDPDVDFVTLIGTAGTGKTLLALAAGLAQTLDDKRYREIVMTRVTVPVGDDIGFLPGTEEEKMTPWMGALMDNLEVLADTEAGGGWGRAATNDLLQSRIKVRSLNFMRGRTFFNRYVILDEAQNLTRHQMRTLITRAGPGTKMVCLGNVSQIDTPWLSGTTSGLTHVVDRFKRWRHSGHVTLVRGERSRLADFATDSL